ncbi:hypothetical protein T484DRAFT_2655166 [Baffinella frigidus]|nr:hypothetical protein T484DRAFT_2655166 [Cryptophyta sp. CCMP2293]
MVVLWGGAVSYARGTPVTITLWVRRARAYIFHNVAPSVNTCAKCFTLGEQVQETPHVSTPLRASTERTTTEPKWGHHPAAAQGQEWAGLISI